MVNGLPKRDDGGGVVGKGAESDDDSIFSPLIDLRYIISATGGCLLLPNSGYGYILGPQV